MQRGSAPSSARNGAAAAAKPASSASSMPDTFVLRATPSIKRYNIARFDVPQVPKFSTCAQPVMMYPEPERVPDEDEEKKDEEPVGYNPALRKRRRRRRKDTRTAGWVIEDQEGKNKFVGTFEGGQQSTYMLLVKNRHNDEFSVMPVEQWFRFKKPLAYRTLTLEEAEDLNNEKKRAVERWLMKHKLAGEDKPDGNGDAISAPRMRTGALGGAAKGGAKPKGEGEDIFSVSESRPRRVARAPKKSEEGGPTGEDGGDFDEKFDDDESEAEIDHDDVKGLASDSEEDEFEVDPEGTGKLTETGQAMKDLLKRAQSGEMLDVANEKGDDNEGDDDDDEDFSATDMDKIKRDLGGNIIHDRSDAASASGDANGKSGVASGSGAGDKASSGVADGGSKGAGTDGSANGAGAGANGVNSRKRPIDEVSGSSKNKDETPTKPKTGTGGTGTTSTTRLTEAGVQQELMRYGGRMRTRDLLRKLRKLIVTDNDKALLKDILRTICDVEVDAIDGRLLVLKSQFR